MEGNFSTAAIPGECCKQCVRSNDFTYNAFVGQTTTSCRKLDSIMTSCTQFFLLLLACKAFSATEFSLYLPKYKKEFDRHSQKLVPEVPVQTPAVH